ncbi:MAG: hypothetical protein AAGB01_09585 [Cyanobacteria bacterium P01_F01_bin.42]
MPAGVNPEIDKHIALTMPPENFSTANPKIKPAVIGSATRYTFIHNPRCIDITPHLNQHSSSSAARTATTCGLRKSQIK